MGMIDSDEFIEYIKGIYCEKCGREYGSLWCAWHCMIEDMLREVKEYAEAKERKDGT